MTLTVRADRRLIRPNHRSRRFVVADIVAPKAPNAAERIPANVSFVLDRSGSMAGEKFRLAHRAVELALGLLRPADRFSIVVYDDRIDVVSEGAPATPEARRNALARLGEIAPRGSTNLAEGWLRGAEQAGLYHDDRSLSRVLLLTDGLANVGITSASELERHAAELRTRGVSTTTFGVGADFDDDLLRRMAQAGGGNFYFIERAEQISDILTSELGEVLEVVARDVALEVDAPPGVFVEPLTESGPELRTGQARVLLPDLVSGEARTVILRLTFPYGRLGDGAAVTFHVRDRHAVLDEAACTLTWEWADDPANDRQARDRDVDRAVARVFAARGEQEAVAFNRRGQYREARRAVSGVAERVRRYAGGDPDLLALAGELERKAERYSVELPELTRKAAYAASAHIQMSRDPLGRAHRPG